jgi:hypothetical protein
MHGKKNTHEMKRIIRWFFPSDSIVWIKGRAANESSRVGLNSSSAHENSSRVRETLRAKKLSSNSAHYYSS